jgi:hypothetical protein
MGFLTKGIFLGMESFGKRNFLELDMDPNVWDTTMKTQTSKKSFGKRNFGQGNPIEKGIFGHEILWKKEFFWNWTWIPMIGTQP